MTRSQMAAEKPMTLTQIAEEINKRLRDLERRKGGKLGLFNASAYRAGNRVMVREKSYWDPSSLPREEAMKFLLWLREGHEGGYSAFSYWRLKQSLKRFNNLFEGQGD